MRIPIDIPGGLKSDDTSFSETPAWRDGCNMRFRLGRPQTIGGWEVVIGALLTGVCRAVFAWTDIAATLNIAFGTHSNLQLYQGGALYDITPAGLAAGAVDGTGTDGFGTGAFGVGGFGLPSSDDYFPRTWSLAAWGQKLLASPRNGTLFEWANNTASVATAVTNAPARITQMLVSPERQVFAFGCTQENGTYNPLCLRHSSVEDETDWATDSSSESTAREYILPGGGEFVGAIVVGKQLLVWTSRALFLGTYVGQVNQVWRFDKVGDECGLIGPNAARARGSTAFWISPDRQFHSYVIGGAVTPVECPIRKDFADNLSPSQADKIVASTIAEFGEIRWDYPDARDGLENSRYVALAVEGVDAGSWYRGRTLQGVAPARTAMVDAGPADNPLGVTADGHIYWHERGNSVDGAAMAWSIKTADFYLDPDIESLVTDFWPDFDGQLGPVTMAVTSRPRLSAGADDVEVTPWGPFMIAPGQSLVDEKMSGRFFDLEFSGFSAPSYVRIGRPVAKLKPRGRRG